MESLTLKDVIDRVEQILAKKRKSRKDLERAREYMRSVREFLAF